MAHSSESVRDEFTTSSQPLDASSKMAGIPANQSCPTNIWRATIQWSGSVRKRYHEVVVVPPP